MGRSYTNKSGEKIKVSESHLDASLELVEELQKASPSRRVSWAAHRRMMMEEGFDDSENSEAYRQMIKAERKARGVLPQVEKYADMVAEGKLESIKNEIGMIQHNKLDARQEFLRLSRLKRELSKEIVLIESLESALSEKDFASVRFTPVVDRRLKVRKMYAGLSDFHYGAIVDVEGFTYNIDIAEELLMKYADELIDVATKENVEEIHVVNMGDAIESAYMRHGQGYSVDKTLSEQIADAAELIIAFLQKLSQYVKVTYTGFNGNHDRMSSKNDTIYSDGAVNVINRIIETFVKYSDTKIKFEATEPYHYVGSSYGRNFLFVHGDLTPIKKQSVLAEQSMLYGIDFDVLAAGHIHHFTMKEVGLNKFVTTFGSIKGSDEYSLKTINTSSSRSQGVILVDEEDFEIRKIKL